MKNILMLCCAILITTAVMAQVPSKVSYQTVIRNTSNNLVTNQAVGIKITILRNAASSSGTVVYEETHNPTTNINGLASLEIGTGIVISGTFASIDWSNGPYFIKTETDPTGGTNYTILGASELVSVPYALHAETATTATSLVGGTAWTTSGNAIYNSNTGNIGIGTTNPSSKLEVNGVLSITGTGVLNLQRNSSSNVIAFNETQPLSFMSISSTLSNAQTRMTINASGDVGIGTTTPSAKLEVTGTITSSSDDARLNLQRTTGANYIDFNNTRALHLRSISPTNTNSNIRMTIENNGKVGIANSSPLTQLDIIDPNNNPSNSPRIRTNNGGWYVYSGSNSFRAALADDGNSTNIYADGNSGTPAIRMNNGRVGIETNPSVVTLAIGPYDDDTGLETKSDGNLAIVTNGIERVRINQQGRLGIGITNPSQPLDVSGNIRATGDLYLDDRIYQRDGRYFRLLNTAGGGNGIDLSPHLSNYGTLGTAALYWDDAYISEIYRLNEYSFSDRRVKENIVAMNSANALTKVMKLKGVTYDINTDVHPFYKNLKEDEIEGAKNVLGFIAQELQEVLPEMVVLNEQSGFYTIENYEQLFPVVVEAIKEQQAQIETLKQEKEAETSKVEALEKKLEALHAKVELLLNKK